MARTHQRMAQCPKCSTWRIREELVHHLHICRGFRCPFCGMDAHNAHPCLDGTVDFDGRTYTFTRRLSPADTARITCDHLACTAPATVSQQKLFAQGSVGFYYFCEGEHWNDHPTEG